MVLRKTYQFQYSRGRLNIIFPINEKFWRILVQHLYTTNIFDLTDSSSLILCNYCMIYEHLFLILYAYVWFDCISSPSQFCSMFRRSLGTVRLTLFSPTRIFRGRFRLSRLSEVKRWSSVGTIALREPSWWIVSYSCRRLFEYNFY